MYNRNFQIMKLQRGDIPLLYKYIDMVPKNPRKFFIFRGAGYDFL